IRSKGKLLPVQLFEGVLAPPGRPDTLDQVDGTEAHTTQRTHDTIAVIEQPIHGIQHLLHRSRRRHLAGKQGGLCCGKLRVCSGGSDLWTVRHALGSDVGGTYPMARATFAFVTLTIALPLL